MKICPKCGAEHDRPHSYCGICFAMYMRAYRRRNGKLESELLAELRALAEWSGLSESEVLDRARQALAALASPST